MQTYPLNREKIAAKIRIISSNTKPIRSESDELGNALWMLEQIPTFDNQGKIDRWIGRVQGIVHTLGLFTWEELQDLTRADFKQASP